MLTIGRIRPGGAEYYVGEVASSAEDYYLGSGEAPGRWIGALPAEMGLVGRVDAEQFRSVLEGRHPFTGEQLVAGRRSGAVEHHLAEGEDRWVTAAEAAGQLRCSDRRVRQLIAQGALAGEKAPSAMTKRIAWRIRLSEVNRYAAAHHPPKSRPGFDLTLRPPKGVSVLWALGDDDQRAVIRQAHREAVDEVVAYLERQAVFARHKGEKVLTHGLVAAAFDHRTSRAGDPLLHTHVVVANLTLTALDTWRALDGRPVYDHALSGGHLYQAHLRHLLSTRLGLRWGPVRHGWADVVGVPAIVIDEFSQRRDEIEQLLAESGYGSARARQAATLASRAAKDYGVAPDTLVRQWRARAVEVGFEEAAVQACFGHEPPTALTHVDLEALLDRLGGPQGVTEQRSTFTRRDVVIWIADAAGARMPAAEIARTADRFLASERVVPLLPDGSARRHHAIGRDGERVRTVGLARFSTPGLLAIEQRLLHVAATGAGYRGPTARANVIEGVLAARPELSAEQSSMVWAMTTATDTVQPIVGRPGSGKTFAAEAVAAAFRETGTPVLGCAVSATAAAELERATGIRSTTIAALLQELDDGRSCGLPARSVLLIDEASMLGTRDLARLLDHVVDARGSIRLIGDPDQHTAVDTGGVFRYLATHTPDVVSLVENNRQTDADERLAIDEYRQGHITEALARYDAAGNIVRCATAGESYDAMVADWYAARLHGEHDPMIAGPNATRRALNQRARALLKAEGQLTGPALTLAAREFVAGDEVVARRNDRSLHAPGRRGFVKNGSAGTVQAVDVERRELVVAFDREGVVRLPAGYLEAGHLEHGYSRTTYLAQGATLGTGRYHPTDTSRFEEGYVALTRARHQTRIYVVEGEVELADETGHHSIEPDRPSLDEVARAMGARSAKTTAHELDPQAAAAASVAAGSTADAIRARIGALEGLDVTTVEDQAERAVLLRARAMQRMRDQLMVEIGRPAVLERVLGPRPPDGSVRAHDWDETAAFARQRWAETGWEPPADTTTVQELLGPAPTDSEGRHRYERVELVHEAARELEVGAEIEPW